MRFLASAKDVKGGIAGVVGRGAGLFEDMLASSEQRNDLVNQLRDEVRAWRDAGYPGTALVTLRLLDRWPERDDERQAIGRRIFFCQKVPCHTELEKRLAVFLDRVTDVVRHFKNERFGISVTYYEDNRPRQYYPDFIVVARGAGRVLPGAAARAPAPLDPARRRAR